jgi:hypothetical protein
MRAPLGKVTLSRLARVALAALALAAALLARPRLAAADERFDTAVRNLRQGDVKTKTVAALALGASDNPDAVPHLCTALSDASESVRQAVAISLKRLNRTSALACLRPRAEERNEPVAAVRLQVQRAIESIEAGGKSSPAPTPPSPSPTPPQVSNAKFYVALSNITNETGRPDGDIERIVHGAIRNKLIALGGYQLAPQGEGKDAAQQVINQRKLKGYHLRIKVGKFEVNDGNLRVRINVVVESYPGMAMQGEVPLAATSSSSGKAAEDQLMEVLSDRAADQFSKFFH